MNPYEDDDDEDEEDNDIYDNVEEDDDFIGDAMLDTNNTNTNVKWQVLITLCILMLCPFSNFMIAALPSRETTG